MVLIMPRGDAGLMKYMDSELISMGCRENNKMGYRANELMMCEGE